MDSAFLIISTSVELVRIAAKHLVYITSDGNYSTIVQTGNESRIVTTQLGDRKSVV